MRIAHLACFLILLLSGMVSGAQIPSVGAAPQPDPGKHSVQFVSVQSGVKLEVLDYGGSGRAMVFLSALGANAHDWDKFAPKFTGKYHVYAFTRRGFGASDAPLPISENYAADRLGDDVLTVMEKLKLERPILVGWSVGGEELSSVGSRFPDKVTALVYLDAGYPYAFYNRAKDEPLLDRSELRSLLELASHENPTNLELEKSLLASLEQNEREIRTDLEQREKAAQASTAKASDKPPAQLMPPMPPQIIAIMTNGVKYTKIPVPILAIFAVQIDLKMIQDPVERAAREKGDNEFRTTQANAFEAGLPNAHVVRIAHAGHDVFATNESDVMREMTKFLDSVDSASTER